MDTLDEKSCDNIRSVSYKFYPDFPQRDLKAFTRTLVHQEMEKSRYFIGYLDYYCLCAKTNLLESRRIFHSIGASGNLLKSGDKWTLDLNVFTWLIGSLNQTCTVTLGSQINITSINIINN